MNSSYRNRELTQTAQTQSSSTKRLQYPTLNMQDGPPRTKPTAVRWLVHQQRSDPTPINPSRSSGESRANRQQVSCPSALIMHRILSYSPALSLCETEAALKCFHIWLHRKGSEVGRTRWLRVCWLGYTAALFTAAQSLSVHFRHHVSARTRPVTRGSTWSDSRDEGLEVKRSMADGSHTQGTFSLYGLQNSTGQCVKNTSRAWLCQFVGYLSIKSKERKKVYI